MGSEFVDRGGITVGEEMRSGFLIVWCCVRLFFAFWVREIAREL